MAFANNENGQILLSGAFLFAIAIAITAIMLNNVIYTNNVAYTGFSEQSIYDDSSLKQMMIDEINYEYYISSGTQSWFTSNMTTFVDVANNITLTKGVYIKNKSINFINNPTSPKSDVVEQQINISGKHFDKSYKICTNYTTSLVPIIEENRNPGVIIKLGINNTTSQNAVLIIDVINCTTYLPEPGVSIILHCADYNINVPSYLENTKYTDANGRYYWSFERLQFLGTGKYDIYVTTSSSLQCSNNLTINIVKT